MKKITSYVFLLCLALCASMFTSCQREDVLGTNIIPSSALVKASIVGQVFDEMGKPMKDAEVRLTDGTTVKTDLNGNFTFQNQKVGSPYGYVKVEKAGYFHASRTFRCKSGAVHYVRIQMLPKTVRGSFNSVSGGTVTFDGVSISLPANGVMYPNGGLYTGQVSVAAQYLNPQDKELSEIMPGDLLGYDSDSRMQLMKTFGMVAVELLGANGEVLQVASGSEATLSLPQIGGMTTSNGDMPLWYFDETAGFWKQEGMAKLENGKWVGKVKHFSFWNCDTPQAAITLDMVLVDNNNNPLPNLHVVLISQNYGQRSGFTNNVGYVGGLIPSNEILTMNVYDNCNVIIFTQQIGPFATNSNLGNVVINGLLNSSVTYTGNVVDCTSQPITNGVVHVQISTATGNNTYYMTTINNGTFSLTIPFCQNGLSASISATDFATLTMSATPVSATVSAGTQNVGTITICGGPVAEFVQVTIDSGTPTVFLGSIDCTTNPDSANPALYSMSIWANNQVSGGNEFISMGMTTPMANTANGTVNYAYFFLSGGTTQTLPAFPTTITAYPAATGDFLDGSANTTYTDGTGVHTVNIVYHVKKDN
ncbi:MAG: carboxypeptidase-like regulatory domain-containing protein [Bacteroidia bacterium]